MVWFSFKNHLEKSELFQNSPRHLTGCHISRCRQSYAALHDAGYFNQTTLFSQNRHTHKSPQDLTQAANCRQNIFRGLPVVCKRQAPRQLQSNASIRCYSSAARAFEVIVTASINSHALAIEQHCAPFTTVCTASYSNTGSFTDRSLGFVYSCFFVRLPPPVW